MKNAVFLVPCLVLLVSCDADKELDKAFAKAGLVRIYAPRTDYAPARSSLRERRRRSLVVMSSIMLTRRQYLW